MQVLVEILPAKVRVGIKVSGDVCTLTIPPGVFAGGFDSDNPRPCPSLDFGTSSFSNRGTSFRLVSPDPALLRWSPVSSPLLRAPFDPVVLNQ